MIKELTEENKARMTKVIEMTPYMVHLGMELVEASDSYAKLKLRYQDENSTAAKALHGGAIASLIDTTGAMAAWTTAEVATPKYFGSTVGVTVNYLSAVIGQDCFAEGRVLKRGKEVIYSEVRVTNEDGKLCAQGTVIYRIIEREPR
ncbi:MAG: PaaI family thioesterase [Chloroflexi bacterium]|nr:PaaI family thioesterase [Chloroflexota bacterium]MCH8161195.1 PaaI family thioesterase [Chloroflexota bacterium]